MSEPTKIKWRIAGEEVGNCNCSWGCPCQFNALPTNQDCAALIACQISDGYFGDIRLGVCVSLASIGFRDRYTRAMACGAPSSTNGPPRSSERP